MVTDPNPFTAFEYLAYADQFYCASTRHPRSILQSRGPATSCSAIQSN